MHIRVGYELIFNCPQRVPMILIVNIHYSRASDMVMPDYLITDPAVPITAYRDLFGNWCHRIVAPAGQIRFTSRGVVRDSGQPDVVVPSAHQHAVEELPEETLVFLRGSRYCETDVLRRSAITSITTSRSAMRMRAARKRPLKPSTSAQASAATIPISPWLSAAV